jgi:hypothetical protein
MSQEHATLATYFQGGCKTVKIFELLQDAAVKRQFVFHTMR